MTAARPIVIDVQSGEVSILPKVSGPERLRRESAPIRRIDLDDPRGDWGGDVAVAPGAGRADAATREAVAAILAGVAAHGDAALADYQARFDGVALAPDEWELSLDHCREALARLPAPLRGALERAAERIRRYHLQQVDRGFELLEEDGSRLGMRVRPLDAVGLYVPGGKAAYPSSVLMNAIPAAVAGVREIVAVTPPGRATDAVLGAMALAGVTRVFRLGGAHAVAALAYGTATVPRVDKIVGPGNRWVAEAKRQLFGEVGIDMVAGPTEVLILADDGADVEHLAADLIAQAEHDEDAVAWLATTSPRVADALPEALERALADAPRAAIAREALRRNGLLLLVPDRDALVAVADRRAPEHLEIVTDAPEALADRVRHAGAIFLGRSTPEPIGDYIAGPSHVLPTGGTARFASPLGVYDFVTRTSIIAWSPARLAADAADVIALAEAEGLFGHAEAVRRRGDGAS